MIPCLINQVETIPQVANDGGSGNWSLYLFIGIVLVLAALFVYFLRKTDKLVKADIGANQPIASKKAEKVKDLNGEEAAAIALAIHLYKSELHDMESLTITLQKVSRIYSPWSSKIYTLRQNPR
jgi:Na+-transporting methylmalonyl-CoA/oxaloacetate decarboxylase gamma subunit